jgi:hypothetical protein
MVLRITFQGKDDFDILPNLRISRLDQINLNLGLPRAVLGVAAAPLNRCQWGSIAWDGAIGGGYGA